MLNSGSSTFKKMALFIFMVAFIKTLANLILIRVFFKFAGFVLLLEFHSALVVIV